MWGLYRDRERRLSLVLRLFQCLRQRQEMAQSSQCATCPDRLHGSRVLASGCSLDSSLRLALVLQPRLQSTHLIPEAQHGGVCLSSASHCWRCTLWSQGSLLSRFKFLCPTASLEARYTSVPPRLTLQELQQQGGGCASHSKVQSDALTPGRFFWKKRALVCP